MPLDSTSPVSLEKCPQCGTPLPAHAPQGLCPACLFAGLASATEAGPGLSSPAPSQIPSELAPHFPQLEILECLGRGGMGVVYKARQKSLNRFVALKLLAPERVTDARFAQRFTHEAQALAALNHPNIVTIYDFGQAGDSYFLLMEFVDGVNLRQAMKSGRFTPEQALAVVPPVCEALQYAHEHGVVHRDIKPENLLLDKEGRVKIADFGIAKILGVDVVDAPSGQSPAEPAEPGETFASVAGTPQYMAPEQKEHRATDHRADIYSLGVVLYELLTGELPAQDLQPPSSRLRGLQIDVRLDEIVLRALEQTPELRYQTAGEFRTQVEAAVAGRKTPSRPHAPAAQTEPPTVFSEPVAPAAGESPARFSVAALAGAFWIPFFIAAAAFIAFVPHRGKIPFPYDFTFIATLLLFVSLTGCFGTTILGWVAIAQIRRSAGRIHGLWLAVFDGLFFPFLALDAFIVALGLHGRARLLGAGLTPGVTMAEPQVPGLVVLLLGAVIVGVDFLIARRVWRAVTLPLAAGNGLAAGDEVSFTSGAMSLAVVSGVLGLGTWWQLPATSVLGLWCLLAAALLGVALALPVRTHPRGRQALFIGSLNAAIWLLFALAGRESRSSAHPASPAAPVTWTFGPVVERVLPFDRSFIDFQSGAVLHPEWPSISASVADWEAWRQRTGADAMVEEAPSQPVYPAPPEDHSFPRLVSLSSDLPERAGDRESCVFICEAHADFDSVHAADADARLQEITARNLYWGLANGSQPWWFQTHDGAKGVLQIMGISEAPRGLKVRYKLVVPAGATAAELDTPPIPEDRPAASDRDRAFAKSGDSGSHPGTPGAVVSTARLPQSSKTSTAGDDHTR